jgi:hypothetical protein
MVVEVGLPNVWGINHIDLSRVFYLSGPMAGYPEMNFPAFQKAAGELRDSGITIVSPHELKLPEGVVATGEGLEYLANDFAIMSSRCSGIILLKGWPRSKGARAELEIALTLEWPVYYYNEFILTNMNKAGTT